MPVVAWPSWVDGGGPFVCWNEPDVEDWSEIKGFTLAVDDPVSLECPPSKLMLWDARTGTARSIWRGPIRWVSMSEKHVAIEDTMGVIVLDLQTGEMVKEVPGAMLPEIAGDWLAYLMPIEEDDDRS